MFAKATIVALLGAAAVSAIDSRAVHSIVTRQLTQSSIPSACQSTCSSALTIYQACLSGDSNTCLSVCQSDNYSGFVGCLDCILQDTPGVTQSDVDELNSALGQLTSACSAAGQTVSAATLTAPSGAAEGSTDSASGAAASFTSATGVIVGGASSAAASATAAASSMASSASGVLGSAASAASGAASSAASAAGSSGAAMSAAHMPHLAGVVMGLIGVGAGAAYIL